MVARFEIESALKGEWRKMLAREAAAYQPAAVASTRTVTGQTQRGIRGNVAAAFTGKGRAKLAGTIRRADFVNKDGAAGIVFSKFGRRDAEGFKDFFVPFLTGATLRARSGRFLRIELAQGQAARRRAGRVRRIDTFLVPVAGRRNQFWVVRKGRGRTHLVAKLVPHVKIRKRLDITAPAKRAAAELPREMLRQLTRRGLKSGRL